MSLPTSVDFPDWNPPRDRAAAREVADTVGTVAAGGSVELTFTPDLLDNVVFVSALIAADCGIVVQSVVLDALDVLQRGVVNAGGGSLRAVIPIMHLGAGLNVFVLNGSGADFDYEIIATAIAGVPPDLPVPAQQTFTVDGLVVPATSDADLVALAQASTYDRATVSVTCDQPYTVSVLRSELVDRSGFVVQSFRELVATVASPGDVTVDVPVGASGFGVIVAGTGITAGTATVCTRLYRSGGA